MENRRHPRPTRPADRSRSPVPTTATSAPPPTSAASGRPGRAQSARRCRANIVEARPKGSTIALKDAAVAAAQGSARGRRAAPHRPAGVLVGTLRDRQARESGRVQGRERVAALTPSAPRRSDADRSRHRPPAQGSRHAQGIDARAARHVTERSRRRLGAEMSPQSRPSPPTIRRGAVAENGRLGVFYGSAATPRERSHLTMSTLLALASA